MSAKDLKKRSRQIDRMLSAEKKKKGREVTLLMLGPGRSGKSTFCKQMRILHTFGFTENERENFKWIVHTNTLDSILDLIQAANQLGVPLEEKNAELAAKLYDRYRVSKETEPQTIEVDSASVKVYALDSTLTQDIRRLWKDTSIREVYGRRNEFTLADSACYYLNSVERIGDDKFVPNEIDILRARLATTSVVETTFEWEGQKFRLVDVGGQRGERKKWLPLFTGITAFIYCVAINEYDIAMEEDPSTNRLIDALDTWKAVVNNEALMKVPAILFLNKKDLFEEKMATVDLKVCFPDYTGGADYKNASRFIEKQFLSAVSDNRQAKVYPYITQATDTKNIQLVWQAVKEIFVGALLPLHTTLLVVPNLINTL